MAHPPVARFISARVGAALMVGLSAARAFAASETWSATAASGAWATGVNWVSGSAPGTADGSASADVATFRSGSTTLTVLPDAGRTVLGITFDTSSAGAFVIGTNSGNALSLSAGGTIQNTAAVNANQSVNAPLVLQGSDATFAFTANSTANSSSRLLLFGGKVAGAAAAGFTNALTLSGVNTALNTVSGELADGAGGGVLSLSKAGTGTWVLAGTNTYSGGTTLTAGTLHLNNPFAVGTGLLTLSGGTLMNSKGSGIVLSNSNAQVWSGDFTFAGKAAQTDPKVSWNLNLGTGSVSLTASRTVTVTGNSSVNGWSWEGATLTAGGPISDGGNAYTLTKAGTGTLLLSASNTFSGGVTLNAGTLLIGHNCAIGPGTLTINGGTLYNSASRTLTHNNALVWGGNFAVGYPMSSELNLGLGSVTLSTNVAITMNKDSYGTPWTVPGVIGESGGSRTLTIRSGGSNPGTLNLRGANTYSGGTILEGAALRIGHPLALGTGPFTIAGGGISQTTNAPLLGVSSQTWSGDFALSSTAGPINLGAAPVTLVGARKVTHDNGEATFGGNISGAGASLTLQGTQWSASLRLAGSNSFDGGVTIISTNSTYTVSLNHPSALGTGPLTLIARVSSGSPALDSTSGAPLTLSTTNAQFWNSSFLFRGSTNLTFGAGAVTLGTNVTVTASANALTVPGDIGDGAEPAPARSLTKAGPGALLLGGRSTYRGGTVVTNGTLSVLPGGALGSGNVLVHTNATLRLLTGTAIADTATVELATVGSNFGKLYLTNGVTEIVAGVTVGGTTYTAPGTYGSPSSGAGHVFPNHISGAGVLRIASNPATIFSIQ